MAADTPAGRLRVTSRPPADLLDISHDING
jgi:hypothetical protein